ncbi:hypothetical protein [Pseudonocardia humida]|uniref:Uncharacterized protein n=1 Tax=Pseudonocardia humida TaxID=2800819 RepID=A0ABT1A9K5_9PSEU|nr:hypothetical protein [Pseudonocardia humida]MCO1659678.1 hypothetical protein [Pseudonocardia humida]
MAVEHETISSPYEVVLGRDSGRLVEVTIRAVGDAELTLSTLNSAFRTVAEPLRRQEFEQRRQQRREQTGALAALSTAWEESGGEISDRYLARLAVAYEEVSALPGRAITDTLADAIGRPAATVKGHVQRARKAGFLTPTGMGRGGGEATGKARELLHSG